jgi:hypothetical protein
VKEDWPVLFVFGSLVFLVVLMVAAMVWSEVKESELRQAFVQQCEDQGHITFWLEDSVLCLDQERRIWGFWE